ncbi:hypothetical protein CYLTODRAFT_34926 [Cylindrobasidium torrendii FP15055 ss-10]|uniref:Uncharacterized protein n=1 Tax=Cylindrobasidium torrendii FP15055 ss-10 TaxID=1314674 RepID=A0A0D7B7W0_9AGAR|nr:hypothetical protein CYLTODRAFT_34926 [Cylindrobasidium torrendii FP15055 ss-10]
MATDIPAPLLIPTDQLMRLTLGLSAGWKEDLKPEITAVFSNTTVSSLHTETLSNPLEPNALQVLYTSIALVAAQAVATGRVLTDTSNERRTSARKRKRSMDTDDEKPLRVKRARMRTNSVASASPPLSSALSSDSKRKRSKHISSITLFRTNDNALTADAAKYCTWQLYFHIASGHLRLAYRDRDAVLHSHKIDIRKRLHFEQFIAICVAHSRLPQQMRIPSGLPSLVPPRERLSLLQRIGPSATSEDSSLEGTTIRLDKDGCQISVKLGKVISDEELLFGRETYVCHATSKE